jgi:predicted ester cyclase
MASSNVEATRGLHKAFNERDWDAATRFVSEQCVFVDGMGIERKGPDGYALDYAKVWADGFSDGEITEAKYYDMGDTVVTEFVGIGTNDGPIGPLPATNRRIRLPYCEIHHYGPDGKLVSGRAYVDYFGLMVQLGHAEAPTGG